MPPKAIDDERIARITAGLNSKPWETGRSPLPPGVCPPRCRPRPGRLPAGCAGRKDLCPAATGAAAGGHHRSSRRLKHAARLTSRVESITDDDLFQTVQPAGRETALSRSPAAAPAAACRNRRRGMVTERWAWLSRALAWTPNSHCPTWRPRWTPPLRSPTGPPLPARPNATVTPWGILMSRVGGRVPGRQAAELLATNSAADMGIH